MQEEIKIKNVKSQLPRGGITHIAQVTGLSKLTVSNILKGKKSILENRKKVFAEAKKIIDEYNKAIK